MWTESDRDIKFDFRWQAQRGIFFLPNGLRSGDVSAGFVLNKSLCSSKPTGHRCRTSDTVLQVWFLGWRRITMVVVENWWGWCRTSFSTSDTAVLDHPTQEVRVGCQQRLETAST